MLYGDLNGKEIQKRGTIIVCMCIYIYIYTHMTDSLFYTAENNTTL